MKYVLFFLWIFMWEAAGYFTVKAIKTHIETKRHERAMANYAIQRMIIERRAEKVHGQTDIVYNPFMGILRGEDSV